MLPTRDPPQNKRRTQTEREGLETNFPSKRTGKKKQGQQYSYQTKQTSNKGHKERPRWSNHNTQRKNPSRRHKHCKYICFKHRAPKYKRKILEDFKKNIDSNKIIVGDPNNPLSKMDRSSKQNIKKDIVSLNNTLDEMELTDIYIQIFIPKKQNIHSFQMHMEHFQRQTT